MLHITLREGDYFMIGGNVKVQYKKYEGRDNMVIGVEAPKDVQILRGIYYEQEIEKLAAVGDEKAAEIAKKLRADYVRRRDGLNERKKSREENERRTAAGEIKGNKPVLTEEERKTRRVNRMKNKPVGADPRVCPSKGITVTDLNNDETGMNIKYKRVFDHVTNQ